MHLSFTTQHLTLTAGLIGAAMAMTTGLVLVGLGQVFDALKEIALNTRSLARAHGPVSQSGYAGLRLIAVAVMGFGGASMAAGLVCGVFAIFFGPYR